jgi:glycerate kinase
MKVVFAPDSFKGSLGSVEVAQALAHGWRSVRRDDLLLLLPQADGGEGTLDVIAAALPDLQWHITENATGPDGRPVRARWLMDTNHHAFVELAQSSGIAHMRSMDPLGATSRGLGEVINDALDHGAHTITVALGGSASTDGGSGTLSALGLQIQDANGRPIRDGAAGLRDIETINRSRLRELPSGGIDLLADTHAVLYGKDGAAKVFGPQKGARPADLELMDQGLRQWAAALNTAGFPDLAEQRGAGAAGGVGFGLASWGARSTPGAARISDLTNLQSTISTADLVITGEGRLDATSLTGKLVGHILEVCAEADVPTQLVVGQVAPEMEYPTISLSTLAGSSTAAQLDPGRWLYAAGAAAAAQFPTTSSTMR